MATLFERARRKRGMVLLVVLSLLTLFVLLGVSYAIITQKYEKAAWDAVRVDQQGDNLSSEIDLVVGTLLHDSRDGVGIHNPLNKHSLLRDLYGDDSVEGTVTSSYTNDPFSYETIDPILQSNGQVQQSQIVMFTATDALGGFTQFSKIPHYYAGRVITFTSSPNNNNTVNLSSRIVDYGVVLNASGNITQAFFAIEALQPKQAAGTVNVPLNAAGFARPANLDTFLINGAPFNGAGAGYDPITRNLDAAVVHQNVIVAALSGGGSWPGGSNIEKDLVALLPNYAGYETSNVPPGFPVPQTQIVLGPTTAIDLTPPPPPPLPPPTHSPQNKIRRADSVALGGVDEKWDAVDLQNMFLAMVPPAATRLNSDTNTTNNLPIIPSFHRPELVNYWFNQLATQIFPTSRTITPQQQAWIMAYPYGPNGVREPAGGDDPVGIGTPPLTIDELDRVHHIVRGSIFRPMPWDHPNFTGSNSNFTPTTLVNVNPWNTPTSTPVLTATDAFDLFSNLINNNPALGRHRSMWDVDNDKDGIPDSIWLDAGLPVITTADGRRIKRMAAIEIIDLDGRIDLNAHGNLMQISPQPHVELTQRYQGRQIRIGTGQDPFRPGYALQPGMPDPLVGATVQQYTAPPGFSSIGLAGSVPNTFLPRGMGFGPAEVNFLNILAGDAFAYAQLLSGRYQSRLINGGAYFDDLDETSGPGAAAPFNNVDARPGGPENRDFLTYLKHHGIPNDYANPNPGLGNFPGIYASPPDVWGRTITALDVGGQPIVAYGGLPNEMLDSPYELVLSGQNTNDDSRYSPAEIERLLRYHDGDAFNLPDRVLRLAGRPFPIPPSQYGTNPLAPGYQSAPYFTGDALGTVEPPGVITNNNTNLSHERRQMLAGMTSHIPAPSLTVPAELRAQLGPYFDAANNNMGSVTILDLYRAKLAAPTTVGGGGLSGLTLEQELLKIVPFEFFRGQKFDINRWLGNGLDENGNFVIDEPNEIASPEFAWLLPANSNPQYLNVPGFSVPIPDLNGDGALNIQDATIARGFNVGRQMFARQLFCLAMLLGGDGFTSNTPITLPAPLPTIPASPAKSPHEAGLAPDEYHKLVVLRIAQWAINCVDFRDHDSIMTGFEFDYNPWDGWQVDGNLSTDAGISAPEAVIPGLPVIAPVQRGVVWGMEAPDLLLTETFGLHDRHVKDTDVDAPPQKRDTPTAAMQDDDLDQFRIPQGSLYFELYCPRPFNWTLLNPPGQRALNQKPRLPRELYDANGQLQLGKMAPMHNGAQWPVWRVGMTPLNKNDANNPMTVSAMPGANAESVSYEPTNLTMIPPPMRPPVPVTMDRFLYFSFMDVSGLAPTHPAKVELQRSFLSDLGNPANGAPFLAAGHYAVAGPRAVTYLGSQVHPDSNGTTNNAMPTPIAGSLWGGYSRQRIELGTGPGIQVYDTADNLTSRPAGQIMPVLPLICTMRDPADQALPVTPATWGKPWYVGLNLTEPMPSGTYYQQPASYNGTPPGANPGPEFKDFYDDPDAPTPGVGILDEPEDNGKLLGAAGMLATDTYLNCSAAYVQRLADPTRPYNPPPGDPIHDNTLPVNPYITVDWASIDVTVFSGEEDSRRQVPSGATTVAIDPSDPNPTSAAEAANLPKTHFRTRQRGTPQGTYFTAAPGTYGALSNPWSPLTHNGEPNSTGAYPPTQWPPGGGAGGTVTGSYLNIDLANSNVASPPPPAPRYYNPANNLHTLGYLNGPIEELLSVQTNNAVPFQNYRGEPATPFPWLTWNNRPYTNPMELLLVPSSSPARALVEFVPGPINDTNYPTNLDPPSLALFLKGITPYDAADGSTNRDNAFRLPFGNLLNFFNSSNVDLSLATPESNRSPHFYRLLDYVEVPSPYVGTERWYNPKTLNPDPSANPPLTLPPPLGPQPQPLFVNSAVTPFKPPYFIAPYNKLSRFRDPGRVNINTVFDTLETRPESVWDALVGHFPGIRRADRIDPTNIFGLSLLLSRQGYGNALGELYQYSVNSPTLFANPFRASDSADLMPDVIVDPSTTPPLSMRKRNPVSATLLRGDPLVANKPLFQVSPDPAVSPTWNINPALPGQPAGAPPGHPLDISRNPYFRFQPLQKLGNILTTNSNCFAVWITIGYFELEDNAHMVMTQNGPQHQIVFDTAHPDGRRLGQEIGADRGNVVRHRAFYIIDRSVPVGFKAGSRLNTDDCILLKRLIE